MKNKIIIVDENDNEISLKAREDIDYSKDIYRVTAIWVTNSKGEVLIAQRSFNKDVDPGKWGPAVAGTVEEGETYESNAYKELEEEIGVTGVPLELGFKVFGNRPDRARKYFSQWFLLKIDKKAQDFNIKRDEVEKVVWVDLYELKKDIEQNPDRYIPTFPERIKSFVT